MGVERQQQPSWCANQPLDTVRWQAGRPLVTGFPRNKGLLLHARVVVWMVSCNPFCLVSPVELWKYRNEQTQLTTTTMTISGQKLLVLLGRGGPLSSSSSSSWQKRVGMAMVWNNINEEYWIDFVCSIVFWQPSFEASMHNKGERDPRDCWCLARAPACC